MFKLKYPFLSLMSGASFTLILFALAEYGIALGFAGVFLSPGLLLAMAASSGAHDLQTYYLVGGADACLCGGVAFLLMYSLNGKLRHRKDE